MRLSLPHIVEGSFVDRSVQSVASVVGLVAEDQALRLCINYLMSDFYNHKSAGVLQ